MTYPLWKPRHPLYYHGEFPGELEGGRINKSGRTIGCRSGDQYNIEYVLFFIYVAKVARRGRNGMYGVGKHIHISRIKIVFVFFSS